MLYTEENNEKSEEELIMPAAPVTKTLIGSFSMLTKLHIYLMSFQKNAMVNETTRNFWKSSVCSIFSLNQKKRKTILAENQYKTQLPPPEFEGETIIIAEKAKNRQTQHTHAIPKPVNMQGKIMTVSRFLIQESESSILLNN